MKQSTEEITRGHEFYLRHLLLLGQAVPVALKAVIEREVKKRGKSLAMLIDENKETFHKEYKEEFHSLFGTGDVKTNTDSWNTSLFLAVIQVLFKSDLASSEIESIECVSGLLSDLDNYAHNASIPYKLFEAKWGQLHSAMLEIIVYIPSDVQFDCKRMIHSFKSEPIKVNMELIKRMTQTTDVKIHVQMAIEEKIIHPEYENQVFTEKLNDTFVFFDDPTVLICKLNLPDKEVTWRYEDKQVEETDIAIIAKDRHTHCLVIPKAKLKDAGNYSCECGTASTSAFLTVAEKRLKVVEDLHVATEEADVRENCEIILICVVNIHTQKCVWRHKGDEIKQCSKRVASVHGLEHKLTIQNATFEDGGEYIVDFGDVASSTKLTLHDTCNLSHKIQLAKDLYKNWIRGALGLKYLKLGLEQYADNVVKNHHSKILKKLSAIGKGCTKCTTKNLLPSHKQAMCPKKSKCLCSKPVKRRLCPSGGFCSEFYDQLFWDHRFNDLTLLNTDVQNWSKNPWSLATCYISITGYQGKSSAKEVDCSGILSLFINNMFIHKCLGDVVINGETDVFKLAKDARNEILHSANYELSEGQLKDYIKLFTSVLEIKDVLGNVPLSGQRGVQEAISKLKELRDSQIDIYVSEDLKKQMQELKHHAMHQLAEKMEKAQKQKDIRFQQLEKRLKETEAELQLLRDLKTSQTKAQDKEADTVPFEMELHIQVFDKTGETSIEMNQSLYQTVKDYISNQNTSRDITSTEQCIHRILSYISNISRCKMVDVLNNNTSVKLRVHCFTCKATEEFLKVINGNEFQKELILLRTCLEAHDVTASCSSQSVETIRTRICKRVQTKDLACEKHPCSWYCSDHDKYCCSACKDSDHRACVGMNLIVSDRSYGIQNQSLVLDSRNTKIGKYNVKKDEMFNRSDNDKNDCHIASICLLPDGNILVADKNNSRLKKLNSSYTLVSFCDLSGDPDDVCYIGNGTAVISLPARNTVQYVNVSDSINHLKNVKLDHECIGLACHGDTIYVTGNNTVYTYTRECQQERVLYRSQDFGGTYRRLAVSDDGEKIYIVDTKYGLITINSKGNHLFTLKSEVLNSATDVCVVDDCTVLVSDKSGDMLQVDYTGKEILGKVVRQLDGLLMPLSLCYDRNKCRIIVGRDNKNNVAVSDLARISV